MQSKGRLLLFLAFLSAIIPVMLMRDFTPGNELRYLSIADEALRDHHFFAFYNHGLAYADKPPLYMWLVMLSRVVFGTHSILALSLLSVVPALGVVCVMDSWTRNEMDGPTRSLARMMLLTSGLFTGVTLIVRMDMLMCLFIVLALRSFWRMCTEESAYAGERWLFPVYLFLAVFTKGPLGLLIPLCSICTYLVIVRRPRLIPVVWGWRTWSVLVAGCALWWGLTCHEAGTAYLRNLLFHQTIDRAIHAFHHEEPFYYYARCIWFCMAPWVLFVVASIASALRRGVVRSRLHTFLIVASLSSLVMISSLSGKLEIYMLPVIPLMVYAAAIYMPRASDEWWYRPALAIPSAILTLAFPALALTHCAGLLGQALSQQSDIVLIYLAALVLTLCGIASLRRVSHAIPLITRGVLAAIFIASFALPAFNSRIGYRAVCAQVQAMSRRTVITHIAAWRVKNAADMDVYLHRSPDVVPQEADPMTYYTTPTLMVVPGGGRGVYTVRVCRGGGRSERSVAQSGPLNPQR